MSELREHLALIRENWDRHDHWFDALCNNLVRGHMKELERLSQVPPEPVGEDYGPGSPWSEGYNSGFAAGSRAEPSPDLIAQIARLLAADPVCGGRVASGTIEAIARICSQVPPEPVREASQTRVQSWMLASKRAREAAETIRRGIGGKYDREHARALEAFAQFERALLDDIEARVRGLKRPERREPFTGFDISWNSAIDTVLASLRAIANKEQTT